MRCVNKVGLETHSAEICKKTFIIVEGEGDNAIVRMLEEERFWV